MPSYYNIRINFARNSVRHLADQDMKRVIHNGGILDYKLDGRKADFFTFRHTGASHLAEKTKNPVLIIKMMGDTNITTVMRH
jgi:site-specific recombinase XerD